MIGNREHCLALMHVKSFLHVSKGSFWKKNAGSEVWYLRLDNSLGLHCVGKVFEIPFPLKKGLRRRALIPL